MPTVSRRPEDRLDSSNNHDLIGISFIFIQFRNCSGVLHMLVPLLVFGGLEHLPPFEYFNRNLT